MEQERLTELSEGELMRRVLDLVEGGLTITAACAELEVARDGRVRYLRRKYSDFSEALHAARFDRPPVPYTRAPGYQV